MGRYVAAFDNIAGVNTANTQFANLVGSASNRLLVREVVAIIRTAPTTPPIPALARSTARGTQTTTVTPLLQDLADAASTAVGLDTAWSVAPTFTSGSRLRLGSLPATVGAAWVWQFYDQPLIVPATAGAGLTLFNVLASGATVGAWSGHFVWDE